MRKSVVTIAVTIAVLKYRFFLKINLDLQIRRVSTLILWDESVNATGKRTGNRLRVGVRNKRREKPRQCVIH